MVLFQFEHIHVHRLHSITHKIFSDINFPTANILTSSSQDTNLHTYDQFLTSLFFSRHSGINPPSRDHRSQFPYHSEAQNTYRVSHLFTESQTHPS